jgi:hypothetical protein
MAGEKRVIRKVIPGAIGDCEGEGLDPRGATLGVCCENDVVVVRFEGVRKGLDGRNETWKALVHVVPRLGYAVRTMSSWRGLKVFGRGLMVAARRGRP